MYTRLDLKTSEQDSKSLAKTITLVVVLGVVVFVAVSTMPTTNMGTSQDQGLKQAVATESNSGSFEMNHKESSDLERLSSYSAVSPQNCLTNRGVERIGIIGGGVSGLAAASALSKMKNRLEVTVLEKGPEIVPIQHRLYTCAWTHDLDLIYITGLNMKGYGVEPRWKNILEKYRVFLTPDLAFRDGGGLWRIAVNEVNNTAQVSVTPPNTNTLSVEENEAIFEELVRWVEVTESFFSTGSYDGVEACLRSGLGLPNETFGHWTTRHNFVHNSFFVASVMALFGNNPVMDMPACQMLMALSNKLASTVGTGMYTLYYYLTLLGRNPQVPKVAEDWIEGMTQNGLETFLFTATNGYATLFRNVVSRDQIDYRTNAEVAKIEKIPGSQVKKVILADGSELFFDKLIIAARVQDAAGLLYPGHPMKPLYRQAKRDVLDHERRYGVYGVLFMHAPTNIYVNESSYVFDYITGLAMTTLSVPLTRDVVLMRHLKETSEDDIVTVTFQVKQRLVDTPRERVSLVEQLSLVGFRGFEIIRISHYFGTPSALSVDTIQRNWYRRARRAQGVDDIYFVGEMFSGHGVPTTWLHTQDFVRENVHI